MHPIEPPSEERDFVLASSRSHVLRLGLYSIALGAVVLAFASVVIQVPRQVELSCVIRGNGDERVYRFAEDVFVEQYYVQVGDRVSRGMPLVRISSPQIAALVMEYTLARLQEEVFETTELPVHAKTQAGLRLQQQKVLRQLERTHQAQRFALATQQAEIRKLNLLRRMPASNWSSSRNYGQTAMLQKQSSNTLSSRKLVQTRLSSALGNNTAAILPSLSRSRGNWPSNEILQVNRRRN